MNILPSCLRRLSPPPAAPAPCRPAWPELTLVPLDEPAADDDATPSACGWFDSSWELRRGLAVIELSPTLEQQLLSGRLQ